jgi:hypothetical protein
MMGYTIWAHADAAKFECIVGVRKEVIHSWADGNDWISLQWRGPIERNIEGPLKFCFTSSKIRSLPPNH